MRRGRRAAATLARTVAMAMGLGLAACQTTSGPEGHEMAVRVFDQLAFMSAIGGHPITTQRMLDVPYERLRMFRWEGPITAHVKDAPSPALAQRARATLADVAKVAGRPLAFTADEGDANFVIEFVPGERLYINNSEFAACAANTRHDESGALVRAVIRIAKDGPMGDGGCLYHEVLHGFGMAHTDLVPSVLNYGTLTERPTEWDLIVLKTMYDDGMKSGLTRAELLPKARHMLLAKP